MSEPGGMGRREFLLLAAAFGGPLVPWRALVATLSDSGGGPSPAMPALLVSLVRQRASARIVGAAYLEAMPSEAVTDSLVAAIVAGVEGGGDALKSLGSDLDGLRRLLARRVERDFAEGETVCLNGWIVSRTEARLCGLARLRSA